MIRNPFRKPSEDSESWSSEAELKKRCVAASTTKSRARPIAVHACEQNADQSETDFLPSDSLRAGLVREPNELVSTARDGCFFMRSRGDRHLTVGILPVRQRIPTRSGKEGILVSFRALASQQLACWNQHRSKNTITKKARPINGLALFCEFALLRPASSGAD